MSEAKDKSDSLEQVVTEQPESLSPSPGATQAVTDAVQTLPDDKPKSDVLDLDAVKSLIATTVRDAIKESRRSEKQNLDKMEQRLKDMLNGQLATLRDAGIVVSPEQERDLREATRKRIEAEEEQSPPTPAAQPVVTPEPAAKQGEIDLLNAAAAELLSEADITLDDTDPEFASIETKGTPGKFIKSFMKAIEAKRSRLAEGSTSQTDQGNPAAIPPTQAGTKQSILPDGLAPIEYLKRGYNNRR